MVEIGDAERRPPEPTFSETPEPADLDGQVDAGLSYHPVPWRNRTANDPPSASSSGSG
jgi:hypothetical protein